MLTIPFELSFLNISLLANVILIVIFASAQYILPYTETSWWLPRLFIFSIGWLLLRGLFSDGNHEFATVLGSFAVVLCAIALTKWVEIILAMILVPLVVYQLTLFASEVEWKLAVTAGAVVLVVTGIIIAVKWKLSTKLVWFLLIVATSWSLVYCAEYFINTEFTDRDETIRRLKRDAICTSSGELACWREITANVILVGIRVGIAVYLWRKARLKAAQDEAALATMATIKDMIAPPPTSSTKTQDATPLPPEVRGLMSFQEFGLSRGARSKGHYTRVELEDPFS